MFLSIHGFHFKNHGIGGSVTVGLETQRVRSGGGPRARVFFFQERLLTQKLLLYKYEIDPPQKMMVLRFITIISLTSMKKALESWIQIQNKSILRQEMTLLNWSVILRMVS